MTPSQLNELAAVRVMGAVTIGLKEPRPLGYYVREGERCYYGMTEHTSRNFSPATDIADAWRLVEKMRADGWLFQVQDSPKETFTRYVDFWKECPKGVCIKTGHTYATERYPDAMGITLAALRAVGVREEEMK